MDEVSASQRTAKEVGPRCVWLSLKPTNSWVHQPTPSPGGKERMNASGRKLGLQREGCPALQGCVVQSQEREHSVLKLHKECKQDQ